MMETKSTMTSDDLLRQIRQTGPGDALDFSELPADEVKRAVSGLTPTRAMASVNSLGPHVSVATFWWGVQVDVDHEGMAALQAAGGALAGMLTALGVPVFAAVIIAGVLAIWSAFDRGNGVIFYVTWTGVHWFAPR